jgi:hypothetical protein
MPIAIDWTVSAGNLVTSLSVIIAAMTLFYTWQKDRGQRRKERADKVRAAAARTLAKLERTSDLILGFYDRVDSVFVETSEVLRAKSGDAINQTQKRRQKRSAITAPTTLNSSVTARLDDVEMARDHLWKGLTEEKSKLEKTITDEQIETSYVDLLGYVAAIYEPFMTTMQSIHGINDQLFLSLLTDSQSHVLELDLSNGEFYGALFGNKLRRCSFQHKANAARLLELALYPIRSLLIGIVESTDSEIARDRCLSGELVEMISSAAESVRIELAMIAPMARDSSVATGTNSDSATRESNRVELRCTPGYISDGLPVEFFDFPGLGQESHVHAGKEIYLAQFADLIDERQWILGRVGLRPVQHKRQARTLGVKGQFGLATDGAPAVGKESRRQWWRRTKQR